MLNNSQAVKKDVTPMQSRPCEKNKSKVAANKW